jgi:hypothetical protein
MRISHFLMSIGLWVFDNIFVSETIWVYITSKNFHAQSKIALVSIWFRMVSTQNKDLDIQRFSDLEIPTKYQYLTGITILIPMSRFFDTIIDVDYGTHAFTYIPVQHW